MTRPAAATFSGRDKWGEAVVDLLLAGAGILVLAVAVPSLDSSGPVGLWLLVAYTTAALAVTLALVVAVVLTRRMPALADATLDGRPAVVLRTWAPPWWHATVLDTGLAILGPALAVAGVVAGGGWAAAGLLPGLVGLWFVGRVALVVVGRRRRPALWLTADEVVVDSSAGRARAARTAVRTVRPSGRRLVLALDRDAAWEPAPRPWRPSATRRDTLVMDCTDTAHRAGDLADWLAGEVAATGARGFGTA